MTEFYKSTNQEHIDRASKLIETAEGLYQDYMKLDVHVIPVQDQILLTNLVTAVSTLALAHLSRSAC